MLEPEPINKVKHGRRTADIALHRQLDAKTVLRALRAVGAEYRSDASKDDGHWLARCPICRTADGLVIAEHTDSTAWLLARGGDHPAVTVGCRRRCTSPAQLLAAETRSVALSVRGR